MFTRKVMGLIFAGMLSVFTYSADYDFDALKELALKNNIDIQKARVSLENSMHSLSISKASKKPSVSVSKSVSYSGTTHTDSHSEGLSVSYTLADGGTKHKNIVKSELALDKNKNAYDSTVLNVLYELKNSFYTVVRYREQLKLNKKVYERRRKDYILIKLKYHAGEESLQAVKESESNLKDAEYSLLSVKKTLEQEYYTMNILTGQDLNNEYEVDYKERNEDFADFIKLENEMLDNSPEIKNLKIDLEVEKIDLLLVKAEYRPTVSTSYSNGFSGAEPFDRNSWSTSMSMRWTLFDGNKQKYKMAQQKNSLDILEKEFDINILEYRKNLKKLYDDYFLALKQYELDLNTLKSKEDIYKLTKLEYEQGATSYFFLQQKESELTSSENRLIISEYNKRIKKASLIKALGRSE